MKQNCIGVASLYCDRWLFANIANGILHHWGRMLHHNRQERTNKWRKTIKSSREWKVEWRKKKASKDEKISKDWKIEKADGKRKLPRRRESPKKVENPIKKWKIFNKVKIGSSPYICGQLQPKFSTINNDSNNFFYHPVFFINLNFSTESFRTDGLKKRNRNCLHPFHLMCVECSVQS